MSTRFVNISFHPYYNTFNNNIDATNNNYIETFTNFINTFSFTSNSKIEKKNKNNNLNR